MSLVVDEGCLQCMLNRNRELILPLGTEEKAEEFLNEFRRIYENAPEGVGSPWFSPLVTDMLHKYYGLPIDRYREDKEASNRFVLERMDTIREKVFSAADPVLAGLQFSILGNYLDFAALQGQVNFSDLDRMLDEALEMQLDLDIYGRFCRELEQGKKLLYLTDNAGEIGFDRVFGEAIAAKYPHLEILFCVRGDIAQNDATEEDARAVGIPFPVIGNGNRIPGTQIDMLSQEAKAALDAADVILSKGMGNCETMLGCGYNIYYAFLVKCQRFVSRFGSPMFTPMLVAERA